MAEIEAPKLSDNALSLIKFLVGTVGLAVITTIVDSGFKQREINLKEMELISNHVDLVTKSSLEERIRFAQYFSRIVRDDELRVQWKSYYNELKFELASTIVDKQKEALIAKADMAQIQETLRNPIGISNDSIKALNKEYDRLIVKKEELQNNIKTLSQIEKSTKTDEPAMDTPPNVLPVADLMNTLDPVKTVNEKIKGMANNPLAVSIFRIHNERKNYYVCFTPKLIKKKAYKYDYAENLRSTEEKVIKKVMEEMLQLRLLESEGCSEGYFSAEDEYESSVQLFKKHANL